MTIGIYGIFDATTDECLYIGMSKDIEERWKQHLKILKSKRHKRKDFTEWYHSNGATPDLLMFRILEECEYDVDTLNRLEIKYFDEYLPKYYGKKPSLNEKWEHSEEVRKKISESISKNQPKKIFEKICEYKSCQKDFVTDRENRKFCSPICGPKSRSVPENLTSYDELYDLYWNQNLSRREIGDILGVKRSTVGNLMKCFNVPTRYKGGSKKS